jgi:hypothetical protein
MPKLIKEVELKDTANLFYNFFNDRKELLKELGSHVSFAEKGEDVETVGVWAGARSLFETIVKLINMVDRIEISDVTLAHPEGEVGVSYSAFKTKEGKAILYCLMDAILGTDLVGWSDKYRVFYLIGMRTFLVMILEQAGYDEIQFMIDYNYERNRGIL